AATTVAGRVATMVAGHVGNAVAGRARRFDDPGSPSAMPPVTPALAFIIFIAGTVAGGLGALLGLGGGIFLVPFLNLGFNFPITAAAAISLTTVIATSSSVSAQRAGKQLINLRLGMLLEVATAAGSLLGGVTAQLLPQAIVQRLF